MTVQLEYMNHLLQFFKNMSHYAGIMLNAFNSLLWSKLYWYNRLVPKALPIISQQSSSTETSCTNVTEFAKRGLIHASNLSTLRICNSVCVTPIQL